MTIGDIDTNVSFRLGVDTNAYPAADRLIAYNKYMFKVQTMMMSAQDGWDVDDTNHTNKHSVVTRALVADCRDYLFSTALWALIGQEGGAAAGNAAIKPLKIKRVDICYDGTGNTCNKAEPVDTGEMGLGLGNDSDIDARFSKSAPFYDVSGNSLSIYPRANAANVTNGGIIRMEFIREFDAFTSAEVTTGTKEPGFDEPWHVMIALGAALDYAIARGLETAQALSAEMQDYEARLRRYYSSKELDRHYVLTAANLNYK